MSKVAILSDNAPSPIGSYSQAIGVNGLVFLSGQIPLDPATMEIVQGDFEARARRVFENLKAVAQAAGGGLDQIVKLTIYMTDLGEFATVNSIMAGYFKEPFPARATVAVRALPKNADLEVEAILAL